MLYFNSAYTWLCKADFEFDAEERIRPMGHSERQATL